MNLQRRHFLLRGMFATFPLLAGANCASAQSADRSADNHHASTPRVLLVLLRGGFDADSLLFQADNSFYHDARPTIAIGRQSGSASLQHVQGPWFVHPAWSDLYGMIEKGELAFAPFSGSGDNSRSHFAAQDAMERGYVADGKTLMTDGIANRILQRLSHVNPDNRGGFYTAATPPVSSMGKHPFAGMGKVLSRPLRTDDDDAIIKALTRLYDDPDNVDRVSIARLLRGQASSLLQQNSNAVPHGADDRPVRGIAGQFHKIGVLMKQAGPFSVAVTEINGWDTHAFQGNETGNLANRFSQLAMALSSFRMAVGDAWKHTHVAMMSEFGRTFRENGTRGTDHGHGSTLILASGKPFEARVIGTTHEIAADTLHDGRDQPVLNTYLSLVDKHILDQTRR